jgi:hypothetical protein
MPRQPAFVHQAHRNAFDFIVHAREVGIGDGFAIDADALVDSHQVR